MVIQRPRETLSVLTDFRDFFRLVASSVARLTVATPVSRDGDPYGNRTREKRFPAEWKRRGRAARPKRNEQMPDYAEALVAVCVAKAPTGQT